MTGGLTKMQLKALDFIAGYIEEHRFSPTYTEIGDALGLTSKSGINRLVSGLEERGRVRKIPGRARSIEVIEQRDSRYHLRRILDAISKQGFIKSDDPVIADAMEVYGGRDAYSRA